MKVTQIDGKETFTVRELIEALQEHDPDMPVLSEGCDCYGNTTRLSVHEDIGEFGSVGESYVLIERTSSRL